MIKLQLQIRLFIRIAIILLLSSSHLLGQQKNNVQVKVYNQSLAPQENIEIIIAEQERVITNSQGLAFVELPEADLPPASIRVNHQTLEVESWNYSRGVLEIILRTKSYAQIEIRLLDVETSRGVSGVLLNIIHADTTIRTTSDQNGLISFALPLNKSISNATRFVIDGYDIKQTDISSRGGKLMISKEIIEVTQPPEPKVVEITKPENPPAMDEITIDDLDSITSLTVLYSFMKNLDLLNLDPDLKKRLDDKFDELMYLEVEQQLAQRDPLALINDSSIVNEDIYLIVEKIKLEELLLLNSRLEFENASKQIQLKLEDGGQNLNEEERERLVQQVLNLRELLRKNEELFYKNNAYYNQQVNSLLGQLANIYELEDLLIESEEESSMLRERFIFFFMAFLVLSVFMVLMIYLIRIFKSQKYELAKANEEIKVLNENLEKRISEKTESLKHLNYELDTFLYRSSHNLRRPLTSLDGLVNVAKLTLGKEGIELFEQVRGITSEMEKMINKLSMMNFIHIPSDFGKISFEEIINNIKVKYLTMIEQANIDFGYTIQSDLVYNSYPTVLELLIQNLVENAILYSRYTSSERPAINISVRRDDDKKLLKIEVKDNGCGIDEEVSGKIWDMFFVGNVASKGNGLGLYITKNAVESLKGTTEVETKTGVFTKFIIKLPFLDSEPKENQLKTEPNF